MFDQIISDFSILLNNVWRVIYVFFGEIWWVLLFFILLLITHSVWLYWRQLIYKNSRKYVLLEIQIPREVAKKPLGMEQVLKAIWGLRNWPEDFGERYWKGEVTKWFTLEMVSFGGEIHFYIRTEGRQRDLVKAAFLSYYSDIEIMEVEDYIESLPKNVNELENQDLDLWGSEIILAKPDALPIKMYDEFELQDKEGEKTFDPISSFLEVLGGLKKREIVGIQINIAPAPSDWGRRWMRLVERLQKPKRVKTGVVREGVAELEKLPSTPGEIVALKAIEENLSDQAFNTLIRFIYISPRAIFYDSFARRGLIGAFNQFAASGLNSFRQNYKMSTRTRAWVRPYIFPGWRNKLRRERILSSYLRREMPEETFMGRVLSSHPLNWNFHSRVVQLSVKAVATLFHPPTRVVLTTPHIRRLESRKAAPEVGLSIFGEEKSLEKFGQ